ncbi:MAG: hypothetical protein KF713_08615 [Turneriella sp.]|nr:hypothetical protein [Turneriella sp.]
MIKYIAYCDDNPLFLNNRVIHKRSSIALEHDFLYLLATRLKEHGTQFITGDLALTKIATLKCRPAEVGLIATTGSRLADYLESIGAKPIAFFGFESPLWDQNFYTQYDTCKTSYPVRIFFRFMKENQTKGLQHPYFPKLKNSQYKKSHLHWRAKKLISFVTANKYLGLSAQKQNLQSRIRTFLKSKLLPRFFPEKIVAFRKATIINNELQTKRLELIRFFSKHPEFSLYGNGWEDLTNLPPEWQTALKPIINSSFKGKIKDKIAKTSEYKFALCIENGSYYGYITEKIIDAFIAGVVPVYLGAPDIKDYIPDNCFIDYRNFKSDEDLLEYLSDIRESEYETYLHNIQEFMSSNEGKKYSHYFFAETLFAHIRSLSPEMARRFNGIP